MAENAATVIYKLQDCYSSQVADLPFSAGTLIFCSDSGECYYDPVNGTSTEDRISVSQYTKMFATESEREAYLYPETNALYVVKSTNKTYIYKGSTEGWKCLNPDTPFYFDIENVTVATGTTGTTISDARIDASCTGTFKPLASLDDLVTVPATVTCSNGSAKIVLDNSTQYPIIGILKISGFKTTNA